jgi:hypothetical protein
LRTSFSPLIIFPVMPLQAESFTPDLKVISHMRIWYENDTPDAPDEVWLQLSGFDLIDVP